MPADPKPIMSSELESPRENLAEAPIIEAVFDIKVELPPDLDLVKLVAEARKVFTVDYPKASKFFQHSLQVSPGEDAAGAIEREKTVRGVRLRHHSENQLIHVHQEGFSFNRLAPYTSYDDYLPEVRRCWDLFCEMSRPVSVRRLALRNINRLQLPKNDQGTVPLSTFLQGAPGKPKIEGVGMTGFVSQRQLTEFESGLEAAVTFASEPSPNGTDRVPMILDIDASSSVSLDPTDSEIWTTFAKLRGLKNRIFHASVTEECLNQYR